MDLGRLISMWFADLFRKQSSPLKYMRLKPDGYDDNALMLQFFTWDCLHESLSWWQHFEQEVPKLAAMGVTQVWLPPPNKAAKPTGRGYDAYDLWDLGEFNQKRSVRTRWGTREEFLKGCQVAKEHGIDILIDAVLNHKLGADRAESVRAVAVDPNNRTREVQPPRDIEAWTAYDYPGRAGQYSAFRWDDKCFTGVDFDHKLKEKGIFKLLGEGHNGWSKNVDTELGNYDFLLGADIDHRHPGVRQDLNEWGKWILETSGASGFRLDAIKHIDKTFLLQWIQQTRQSSGMTDMFSVSECWSGDIKKVMPYIRAFKGETTFFDVPLHMHFHQASRERSRYDLTKLLKNTIVSAKPEDAVTFVDNHEWKNRHSKVGYVPSATSLVFEPSLICDTACLTLLLNFDDLHSISPTRSNALKVDHHFKTQAYAIILLRGYGHPCVFYGDIYPNDEGYSEDTANNVKTLVELRRKFAYGATLDYFVDRNCIGWVRSGDEKHRGCAVVLSNKEGSSSFVHEIRMNVGKENVDAIYKSAMTEGGEVKIDGKGWGTFSCFANHVQVWVRAD